MAQRKRSPQTAPGGYHYEAQERSTTTPDGLRWIDPDGREPDVDEDGRLRSSFRLVLRWDGDHPVVERWATGLRLPCTGRAWELFRAECARSLREHRAKPKTVEEALGRLDVHPLSAEEAAAAIAEQEELPLEQPTNPEGAAA